MTWWVESVDRKRDASFWVNLFGYDHLYYRGDGRMELRQISGRRQYSFLQQKYTTRSIRTWKRNGRKRMKRERSRREKGIKNGLEEFGGITPILFMSLYISVFQETITFLLGLKGVSASSINSGLRKIMIKRKVIPLSLAQSYLRTYISPQS